MPTGREDVPSNRRAEQQVLALVNKERAARRLEPLGWDEGLARAARFHAAHMAVNGYFDHRTMSGRRRMEAADRMALFSDKGMGENIGRGYRTAEEAVAAWMASSGHRANILAPEARWLGVGVWGGFWVQDFGW
jgi:uncharacterized protein YkwD